MAGDARKQTKSMNVTRVVRMQNPSLDEAKVVRVKRVVGLAIRVAFSGSRFFSLDASMKLSFGCAEISAVLCVDLMLRMPDLLSCLDDDLDVGGRRAVRETGGSGEGKSEGEKCEDDYQEDADSVEEEFDIEEGASCEGSRIGDFDADSGRLLFGVENRLLFRGVHGDGLWVI